MAGAAFRSTRPGAGAAASSASSLIWVNGLRGLTLDRIDVDGHYTAANCRWADLKLQRWNRRDMLERAPERDDKVIPLFEVEQPDYQTLEEVKRELPF